MNHLIKFLSVFVLLAVFASGAEAQIFKKLKKKAQNALEQKAEQKVDEEMQKAADKMVDDSWDAIFGGIGENFTLNSNVTTEEVYDFDVVSTMEIKSERANGKAEPPMYMDMHFKEGAQYTGTQFRGEQTQQMQGDLFIIYDLKNSAMIMLMQNENDKFSFAYDWKQAIAQGEQVKEEMKKAGYEEEVQEIEDADEDAMDAWGNYKKIGSKNIAGYNCDGYRSQNEQQIVEVWVTRDADFGMQNMFQANANTKQLKGKLPEEYPSGMMMKMTMEDLKDGDKVFMEVTNIKKNANVRYAMADYPAMSLGKK